MLRSDNKYFDNIKQIAHQYEKDRSERQSRKKDIIQIYGWDSPELKAWYEEDSKFEFPFSSGITKAYRAWAQSLYYKEDEVEMSEFLWDTEVKDFVDTLRNAGILHFVYTNQSTAVMQNIHSFVSEGCMLIGLCTITRYEPDSFWNDDKSEILGIKFSIN